MGKPRRSPRISRPSPRPRSLRGPLLLLPLLVVLAACWDLRGGPSGPYPPQPVAIDVEPTEVDLVVGGEARLEARVLDGKGAVIEGVPVEWSTSDVSVVRLVGTAGRIRAVGEGTARVIARISHRAFGTLEGSTTVRVSQAPTEDPRTLTVIRRGGGLVYTEPAGIAFEPVTFVISDSISAHYPEGTEVEIIAEESVGFLRPVFSGEGCSGSTCTVTMTEDRRVTVTFVYAEANSIWSLRGGGSVVYPGYVDLPTRGSWSCGALGPHRLCNLLTFRPVGLEITTEATPEPGWRFREWEGECTHGDPVCVYTVAGFLTQLTAVFEPEPAGGFTSDELWPRFGDDLSLEFTAPAGGPDPAPVVHRFNEAPALSIHPINPRVPTLVQIGDGIRVMVEEDGNAGILTVTASPAGLDPGVYRGSLMLRSWKALDHPFTVEVTLTVTP